jgi:hypothetical protein
MPRPRWILAALVALLPACSSTARYQSHWNLHSRPPAEARTIAVELLRELGYTVEPGNGPCFDATYADDIRSIVTRVEIRPAGNECEIRVTTEGDNKTRTFNAYERLLGRLDARMKR